MNTVLVEKARSAVVPRHDQVQSDLDVVFERLKMPFPDSPEPVLKPLEGEDLAKSSSRRRRVANQFLTGT